MSNQTNPHNIPKTGVHPPKRNNPLAKRIGRFLLRITRWRFIGELPDLPKFVIIGGPHTSNWDTILAVTIVWAIDLDVVFMAKKEAFIPVFGRVLRRLGALPVNRQSPVGVIDQVVAQFEQHDKFVLGITPEGTRSKVTRWKTGFYRIAMQTNVPIFPITVNFRERKIFFNPLLTPTGDMDKEIALLRAYFDVGRGRHADLG